MTPTHPDLDGAQLDRARRELGFPDRGEPRAPKPPEPSWRTRVRRTTRRALRPVYARLADAVAERIFVENPVEREVDRLETALTRVEAELELLRGQVAAQRALLDRLDAGPDAGEPPGSR